MVHRDSNGFAAKPQPESKITVAQQKTKKKSKIAETREVVSQRVSQQVARSRAVNPETAKIQKKMSKESIARSRLKRKAITIDMTTKQINTLRETKELILKTMGEEYYESKMQDLVKQLVGDKKAVESDSDSDSDGSHKNTDEVGEDEEGEIVID